eukprot:2467961-Amphidinium_carterae.1
MSSVDRKEFRVHNALFAYRHLVPPACKRRATWNVDKLRVGCALGIWCADWWWRHPMTISSLLVKVAVVLGTSKAADITTAQIGSRELRTTNAMPYPEKVPGCIGTLLSFGCPRAFIALQAMWSALQSASMPSRSLRQRHWQSLGHLYSHLQ